MYVVHYYYTENKYNFFLFLYFFTSFHFREKRFTVFSHYQQSKIPTSTKPDGKSLWSNPCRLRERERESTRVQWTNTNNAFGFIIRSPFQNCGFQRFSHFLHYFIRLLILFSIGFNTVLSTMLSQEYSSKQYGNETLKSCRVVLNF